MHCKKVSTQNERFLRPSHVHALTPANSNRSYGADHHHHHGAHHPLPRGIALPRQHRLPLGPVQQERHGRRHRGQLEARLGHQQWTARVWKGNLPGGLSGAKEALRLKIFLLSKHQGIPKNYTSTSFHIYVLDARFPKIFKKFTMVFWAWSKLEQLIRPICLFFFALPSPALKKPLWNFNFLLYFWNYIVK